MFEKKKKAAKNADLMKKAPAAGTVELSDDVLETAAGGRVCRGVRGWYDDGDRSRSVPDPPFGRA